MAAAAPSHEEDSVVCGYCWENVDHLEEPKKLPCAHVFCTPCLTEQLKAATVLVCGTCRTSYDMELRELASVNATSMRCHLCSAGGLTQDAVIYCTNCACLLCIKHKHDHEADFDHTSIDIDIYSKQPKKLETRFCPQHRTSQLSMVCMACSCIICEDCCGDGTSKCTRAKGAVHRPVSLNAIADKRMKQMNDLNLMMKKKEERLSSLSKHCSRAVNQFDEETEELVHALHRARDEQIKITKMKYAEMEVELVQLRKKSKESVVEFMECVVEEKLNQVMAERQRTTARIRDCHQVDLVSTFKATEKLLQRLIEEDLPYFTLENLTALEETNCQVAATLMLTESSTNTIIENTGVSIRNKIPMSAKLFKRVQPNDMYRNFCTLGGKVYAIAISGQMCRIDENYQLSYCNTRTSSTTVNSVTSCGDKLYLLNYGKPWRIRVLRPDGVETISWKHEDSADQANEITCVGDKLVIPNISTKQLTVYSLDGRVVKQIPLSDLSYNPTYINVAGTDSVIISITQTSLVLRINISSGEVMWRSKAVTRPCGTACYRDQAVLVVEDESLTMLDLKTGKLLGKLSSDIDKPCMTNILMDEDQLITTRYIGADLFFYKVK